MLMMPCVWERGTRWSGAVVSVRVRYTWRTGQASLSNCYSFSIPGIDACLLFLFNAPLQTILKSAGGKGSESASKYMEQALESARMLPSLYAGDEWNSLGHVLKSAGVCVCFCMCVRASVRAHPRASVCLSVSMSMSMCVRVRVCVRVCCCVHQDVQPCLCCPVRCAQLLSERVRVRVRE